MSIFYFLISTFIASASVELGERPWSPPDYESQTNVLGYSKDTFSVPEELMDRVQFWVDIYTKYNTNQGILHDSKHLDLIYEMLDFSKIEGDSSLSPAQIEREKKKYVKERKKYYEDLFEKFQNLKSVEELTESEKKLWERFEKIDEPNKFSEASRRGRMRLQMGLRDRFIQAIYDSGKYLEQMESVFREKSLPLELTRLPFVESSFNLMARSKSGASGIWQIMPYTGRRMMKVNYVIDERNEPIEATKAAAKLLKFNYDELKNWPMAVTAYNFGVAGMKRVIKKTQSENLTDFLGTRPTRKFGFASSSFYASFLAALIVEKDASKYFPKVTWGPALKFDEVISTRALFFKDLLPVFDENEELALKLNPHFSRRVVSNIFSIPKNTKIHIPFKKTDAFLALEKTTDDSRPIASVEMKSYKIAPGDTLYDISRMFQVTTDQILSANDDLDPRRLRPGQMITIP